MKFILKGNPLSTQNIYRHECNGPYPRVYMIKAGKVLKEFYEWTVNKHHKGKVSKDICHVTINLFFKDKRKRDVDNFNKLILDAMEGIVYENDNQIKKLTIEKFISKEDPRVEVEVNFI